MAPQELELSKDEQELLLSIAFDSIEYGVKHRKVMSVSMEDHSDNLLDDKATFITLKLNGDLRGCIGVTQPMRPLVIDVVHNAYAAAFKDPRFVPVEESELSDLEIHISILSIPEPIEFGSEEEFLSKLRPGTDGLILDEGSYRGAFLPVMWEQLPEPVVFLRNLKVKAGLQPDYWSNTLKISRFTAEYYLEREPQSAL